MEGLCAVVPDAHRDPPRVEELSDVVRVHAVDVEGAQGDAFYLSHLP